MRIAAIIILGTAVITTGCASPFYMGQQPSTMHRPTSSHMSEERRAAIKTVLVRPSDRQPVVHVDGDYLKETPTVGEGAAAGAGAGFAFTGEMIAEDARGILIAPIVLPFALYRNPAAHGCARHAPADPGFDPHPGARRDPARAR